MAIYFLGGGNMASAIISGLHCQGGHAPVNVAVVDRSQDKLIELQQRFGIMPHTQLPELIADDVLVLAVKPQDMAQACSGINTNGALILSVAAGLSVAMLEKYLNTNRIIRIMPNTPCSVGVGVSGLFAAVGARDEDRHLAEKMMQACGMTVWLENENSMHHITAISGSGPAYVFYLLDALKQAAQSFGFAEDQAHSLSLATFKGAVVLAEQSGKDFADLQAQVTSKGGTTFAALEMFKKHDIAAGIQQGTVAAAARSEEISVQS